MEFVGANELAPDYSRWSLIMVLISVVWTEVAAAPAATNGSKKLARRVQYCRMKLAYDHCGGWPAAATGGWLAGRVVAHCDSRNEFVCAAHSIITIWLVHK